MRKRLCIEIDGTPDYRRVRTMQINRYPITLLFLLLVMESIETACPDNFTDVGDGQCMIKFTDETMHWCEAHNACYRYGLDHGLNVFLVGRHAEKLKLFYKGRPIHTGINGLLDKPVKSKSGWRVSDPADYGTISVSAPWADSKPSGATDAVVEYVDGHFNDAWQKSQERQVVCELSKIPVYAFHSPSAKFGKQWPKDATMDAQFSVHHSQVGCFRQTNTATLLECGLLCKLDPVCRSFYYSAPNTCYMSQYIDSRLPSKADKTRDYTRFARMTPTL